MNETAAEDMQTTSGTTSRTAAHDMPEQQPMKPQTGRNQRATKLH